jgi:hypothetical protein
MDKFYRQTNWSGGISDSDVVGVKGSLADAVGVDVRTEPGILKVAQALEKKSSGTVTDFCKYALLCSTGSAYFFGDTGIIYERKTSGGYGTVHIDSKGTIKGCGEYDGYIYWATDDSLRRIATGSSWASGVVAWGSLTASDTHQMTANGLFLYILNSTKIASVDETGTLTLGGTVDVTLGELADAYRYSCITNFGLDVLMGTKSVSGAEESYICRWDTVSPSWTSLDLIPEKSINAFITVDNYVLAQAGNAGNLYLFTGEELEKFRRIKGDYDNKSMTMYPGSVCQFRGFGMFGVSNLYGNPLNQGVYTLGQYSKDFPMSLVLEYPTSTGSLYTTEIGGLLSSGTWLAVPWKYNSTYGIDEISWAKKYTTAYVKTLAIGGSRHDQKEFKNYVVSYKEHPSGTDITLNYYKNYSSSLGTITLYEQTGYNKWVADESVEAGVMQFKIAFSSSSNDAPEIEDLYATWNERDVL